MPSFQGKNLEEWLDDSNQSSEAFFAAIKAMGEPAIPYLEEVLRRPRPVAKKPAVPEAREREEENTWGGRRCAAALAMAQLGPPAASLSPAIMYSLTQGEGSDEAFIWGAAMGMDRAGYAAWPAAIEVLNDPGYPKKKEVMEIIAITREAFAALPEDQARRLVSGLRLATGDEDANTREYAITRLAEIHWPGRPGHFSGRSSRRLGPVPP